MGATDRTDPRDTSWLDGPGPLGGILDRKQRSAKKADVILIDDDEPLKNLTAYSFNEGSRKRTATAAAIETPSSYYPTIDPRIPPPTYGSPYGAPPTKIAPPPTTG